MVDNEFGGISLELSTDETTDDNNTDVLTWFDASKLEIKEDIFKLYEVLFNHLVSSDYKVIR
jgi:hypothetical protein